MKTHKNITSNSTITFILLSLISLTLLGMTISSGKNKQGDIQEKLRTTIKDLKVENIKLTNRTSAFSIENVEKTVNGNIKIRLRNGYKNIITAYKLSFGSTTAMVEKLDVFNSIGIQPGEVIEHLEAINVDPDLYKKGIIILAVIFDGGSSDGSPEAIRQINDHRLGQMIQIERAQNLLQQISSLPDNDLSQELDAVKGTFLSKDDSLYKSLPDSVRFGIDDAKDQLAIYIDNIKRITDDKERTKGLKALVNYCEHKASIFRTYNETVKNKLIKQ